MSEFYRGSPDFENTLLLLGEEVNPSTLILEGDKLLHLDDQKEIAQTFAHLAGYEGPLGWDQKTFSDAYNGIATGIALGHMANLQEVHLTATNLARPPRIKFPGGVDSLQENIRMVSKFVIDYGRLMLDNSHDLELLIDDGIVHSLAQEDLSRYPVIKSMIAFGFNWARGVDIAELESKPVAPSPIDDQVQVIMLDVDLDEELRKMTDS